MIHSNKRRDRTQAKQIKRKKLALSLGLQGGTIYIKHIEKFNRSSGFVRDGNVSHYALTKRRKYYKRNKDWQKEL